MFELLGGGIVGSLLGGVFRLLRNACAFNKLLVEIV